MNSHWKALEKGQHTDNPDKHFPFPRNNNTYRNQNLLKFHSSKKWFEWQKFEATPDGFQFLKPRNWQPIKNMECRFNQMYMKNGWKKKLQFLFTLQRSTTWNCEKHTFFCTLFFFLLSKLYEILNKYWEIKKKLSFVI